jgi:hypothetical protein
MVIPEVPGNTGKKHLRLPTLLIISSPGSQIEHLVLVAIILGGPGAA